MRRGKDLRALRHFAQNASPLEKAVEHLAGVIAAFNMSAITLTRSPTRS
jgi:hypothetical protein